MNQSKTQSYSILSDKNGEIIDTSNVSNIVTNRLKNVKIINRCVDGNHDTAEYRVVQNTPVQALAGDSQLNKPTESYLGYQLESSGTLPGFVIEYIDSSGDAQETTITTINTTAVYTALDCVHINNVRHVLGTPKPQDNFRVFCHLSNTVVRHCGRYYAGNASKSNLFHQTMYVVPNNRRLIITNASVEYTSSNQFCSLRAWQVKDWIDGSVIHECVAGGQGYSSNTLNSLSLFINPTVHHLVFEAGTMIYLTSRRGNNAYLSYIECDA